MSSCPQKVLHRHVSSVVRHELEGCIFGYHSLPLLRRLVATRQCFQAVVGTFCSCCRRLMNRPTSGCETPTTFENLLYQLSTELFPRDNSCSSKGCTDQKAGENRGGARITSQPGSSRGFPTT
ncbi:hypothetical protein HPB48_004793 [Haemaphysalis longicornis]|uniref:Uncharacterized protein n=1 Tax=Haemaphysalis longicornis TaxID=44386 RepID=A0A9J6FCK6_HAELO|nr:hypothetical protein HPB48_004793 [Haemaphysalis longicornis]